MPSLRYRCIRLRVAACCRLRQCALIRYVPTGYIGHTAHTSRMPSRIRHVTAICRHAIGRHITIDAGRRVRHDMYATLRLLRRHKHLGY